MKAILFGSIGSVVETSELQRSAFNSAFRDHGLAWHWDRVAYRSMLVASGGANRLERFASERGETVDAKAVHITKNAHFHQLLSDDDLVARPGVVDVCQRALSSGISLGLVSTTNLASINAILRNVGGLSSSMFDLITSAQIGFAQKPDPAAYCYALRTLGITASDAIAIEDNGAGAQAALRAGIQCLAFPGANTADHDFGDANYVGQEGLAPSLFGRLAA
ncbi:MAG: HAD-IA family hydrolase [Pseudomonadota bacterium]